MSSSLCTKTLLRVPISKFKYLFNEEPPLFLSLLNTKLSNRFIMSSNLTYFIIDSASVSETNT